MGNPIPVKYQEPVTGLAGAGTGLFAGELTSEFVVRTTGQTGYAKAAVKTAVKGILGIVAFLAAGSATGNWSLFGKVFAYTNWGSIILDWFFAYYPGGVFGVAERAAVTVRTWSMGTKRIADKLSNAQISQQPAFGKKVAAAAGVVGSY